MSFNIETQRMDWKDESSWALISLVSGIALTVVFTYFQRFPNASYVTVSLICCFAFYVLSILLRLQNHRGHLWKKEPIISEGKLKFAFPLVGFVVGIALLVT